MKESSTNKILKMVFGFIIIGGAMAILGIYRTAKNTETLLDNNTEGYDGDVFI